MTELNDFGKTLLNFCCTLNLNIMNGRCGTDKGKGDFTFVNANGTSVIDYVISSTSLFTLCSQFDVLSRSDSEHMPIICRFQSRDSPNHDQDKRDARANSSSSSLVWNANKVTAFKDALLSPDFVSQFERSIELIHSGLIDPAVELITTLLCNAADCMKKRHASNVCKQPWFDKSCGYYVY